MRWAFSLLKSSCLTEPIQQLESKASSKQPRIFLRAHLPNQQRTSVTVVAGMKLSSALAKALSRRNLTWNFCEVYCTDNGTESGTRTIPWDTDISTLNCDEISVRVLNNFSASIFGSSHQFIRKTFFSLAFCECCRRLLFTGFYCSQCNYRFHQRCAQKVPKLCSKLQMDTYYQMLLANTDNSSYSGSTGFQKRSVLIRFFCSWTYLELSILGLIQKRLTLRTDRIPRQMWL